jgi:hypothetical protein
MDIAVVPRRSAAQRLQMCATEVEVPLDGTHSKLEDYQMDAGTQAAPPAV